jgi:hypothetical protein
VDRSMLTQLLTPSVSEDAPSAPVLV